MASKRIALIEDDADIAYAIKFNLEKAGGYRVEHFASGRGALERLDGGAFDLVLLDLSLPDVDGLTLCQEIRSYEPTRKMPILMLTARVTEGDRVRGLNTGADDYVTKPFSMPELIARVAAHLRRATREEPQPGERFDDGHLVVDRWEHRVEVGGSAVHLTKKEFDLLWLLLTSRPRVVVRDTIYSRLWDYNAEVESRTVDVHIRALRRKIGEAYIETVVGVGYRFKEHGLGSGPADS